jgi:hypothetical protein
MALRYPRQSQQACGGLKGGVLDTSPALRRNSQFRKLVNE